MKNSTCIIIEDEQLAVDLLLTYIEQVPYLDCLGAFSNSMEAFSFLMDQTVDIIFLDIEMPGMKGVDFVKSLNRNYKIIFTTAYSDYAIDAFNLNAIDYLIKPFEFSRFVQAINKTSLYNLPSSESSGNVKLEKLFVKVDNKIINIALSEILYIQAMQKYIQIHTKSEKFISLISMFRIEESLPAYSFIRVHKSYIVNINNISSIEGNLIRINKDLIPISKGQKENFFNALEEKQDILTL